jgi:xanthine dehydrogenase accessory factor
MGLEIMTAQHDFGPDHGRGADDPLVHGVAWAEQDHGVALATVISTWGSAPRPVGSQLVIRDDEAFEGSVSGGCVEGAVILDALDVMKSGVPKIVEFGVADATAFEVGLACGGRIAIFIEPLSLKSDGFKAAKALLAAKKARRSLVRLIDLRQQKSWLFDLADGPPSDLATLFSGTTLDQALHSGRSQLIEEDGQRLFFQIEQPALRLYLIGAVHIAQALAPMAKAAGYDVTVIDPRGAFATSARFSNVRLLEAWPDEALLAERPDERSAVVTLTHDPKLDDAALRVALDSKAFYIGSLGSRKTHKARLERLSADFGKNDTLLRICGPVGLAIGARTPAEIAISIMAQMTQYLRSGPENPIPPAAGQKEA